MQKEGKHSSSIVTNAIPVAQILKLAGLSGVGNIFEKCIRLFSNIIITRIIGASDFGLFSLGMTVVNMGTVIPRFGLPRSITRFVAYYKGKGEEDRIPLVLRQALLISLSLGIGTAILIYYLAPNIAFNLFHRAELSPIIKGLSPFIPFGIAGTILLGALQGLKQIKKQVLIQSFIWPSVRLALIILFFVIGWKLYGLITAVVLSVAIRFLISLWLVSEQVSLWKPGPVTLPISKLLFFSAPLVMTNVLTFALNWTDTLMLGYFRNPAEVGIYAVSWRLSLIVSIPLVAFVNIFSPMAAGYIGKDDQHSLQSLLQTVNRWILAVSLPLAIIIAYFPDELLSIFGKGFTDGRLAVQFLVFGQLISAASGPCGSMLTMKGWTWLNLVNSAILTIFNILLNLQMIPRFGLLGAALATASSLALINILRNFEIAIFLKIAPYRIRSLKPLLFGMLAIIPGFIFKDYSPVISLVLFVAVYFLLTYVSEIREMGMLKIPKMKGNKYE